MDDILCGVLSKILMPKKYFIGYRKCPSVGFILWAP